MELKPCPFCGGEARIMKITDSGGKTGYAVGCGRPFCPTDGAVTRWFVDDGLAVEAWNTRHVETCKDLGGTGANGEQVFNCSECGCVLSLYDRDGTNTLCTGFIYDYPRYCPACGAKVVDV